MSKSIEPESDAIVDETNMGPHGRVLTTTETDVRFLQKASRANARDAFDPTKFNQRFGKTTRTENTDQAPQDNENMPMGTDESLIPD